MRSILTFFVLLSIVSSVYADVYTFQSAGNWNQVGNWDSYPGTTIDANDEVIVNAAMIINTVVTVNGSIKISNEITFTMNWLMTINGSIINDGAVMNNGQINLFGVGTSNGPWQNTETGNLIVANNAEFLCYDTFLNDGSLIGYNTSKFLLEANFTNNNSVSYSGQFDINHSSGDFFINNDFLQMNGVLRLEGSIINQAGRNFNINPSSTMIIANNSKFENFGTLNVMGNMQMSSQVDSQSDLGHVVVSGMLTVEPGIVEIL